MIGVDKRNDASYNFPSGNLCTHGTAILAKECSTLSFWLHSGVPVRDPSYAEFQGKYNPLSLYLAARIGKLHGITRSESGSGFKPIMLLLKSPYKLPAHDTAHNRAFTLPDNNGLRGFLESIKFSVFMSL